MRESLRSLAAGIFVYLPYYQHFLFYMSMEEQDSQYNYRNTIH